MEKPPKIPKTASGRERRQNPRAKLEQSVRVRTDDAESMVELRKTRDISRTGFYFVTHSNRYYVGMRLYVVLGFRPSDPVGHESLAEVARIEKLPDGTYGVGVHIVMR